MGKLLGDRLDGALQIVEANAAVSTTEAELADTTVKALAETGINRLFLPAALGGFQANPIEAIDVVVQVAERDGSAGWCTAISIGTAVFAGYVPEAAARSMYTDPDAGGAAIFMPMGIVSVDEAGQAYLSGRWPFGSNCLHSRWIGVGAFVQRPSGENDPIPRLMMVERDDVEIERTWRGGGLRRTGSHHLSIQELAVDLERSCAFSDIPWAEGPLWRLPLFTVLGPLLVAALLGTARGAINRVHRRITDGTTARRGSLADDSVGLAELAAADAALRAADAGLRRMLQDNWEAAEVSDPVPKAAQARTALAVLHAADTAVMATSVAHALCGGAAAYEDHPVLTALQDVQTARQHLLFSHHHRAALMRISAGLDDVAPPLVV